MGTAANGFDIIGCLKAAAAIEADIRQLVSALTEGQFHAPARDGGWSVGYCLEHLVLTGQAYLPKWDAAMAGAEANESDAIFPYGWWRRRILQYMENPAKLKHKTPPQLVPCLRHSIEDTVNRFFNMHKELMRRVAGSRGLDAGRTKVQSPFFPWIWCALGYSFDLALAHERRHLHQAWTIRQQISSAEPNSNQRITRSKLLGDPNDLNLYSRRPS